MRNAPKTLSTGEVASAFGVTSQAVRDWIKAEYLHAYRIGTRGHWRVQESELGRLIPRDDDGADSNRAIDVKHPNNRPEGGQRAVQPG
jgi:excisionase family DNA binding protein